MTDTSPAPGQTPSQPASPAPAAAPAAAAPAAAPAAAAPASASPASATPAAASAAAAPAAAAPAAAAPASKPGEAPAPAAPAAPVIPESYTFTAPQGDAYKGFKFDPALAPAISPVFKEIGLTQAQVDKLVPAFIEYQRSSLPRRLEADLQVTMADPKLGQLNYSKTVANVNRALAGFTDPEFRSFLEQAGIANRLEFVRVFDRIGRAMAGDTAALSQPTSVEDRGPASRLYDGRDLVSSKKTG